MGKFVARRIDDMLTIYGDKAVAKAEYDAEKRCERISEFERDYTRRLGEAHAWAAHDSYFIWERPLSNTFEELRDWVTRDDPPSARRVNTWADLEAEATAKAKSFLVRASTLIMCPALLDGEQEHTWWMYMAIIHQCLRKRRAII